MSSRIIVKNGPKYVTEKKLRGFFSVAGAGRPLNITDVLILGDKPKGNEKSVRSRKICFVGFKDGEEAEAAVKHFNKTYMDTCRLSVELALPKGHKDLPRAWSKYSYGSSAHKKKNPNLYNEAVAERLGSSNTGASSFGGSNSAALESLGDSGRLFVVNLSYQCTEEELEDFMKRFGEVSEVRLLRDMRSGASKGQAYVTYAFPSDSVAAYEAITNPASGVHRKIFQGRLLKVYPAEEKLERAAGNEGMATKGTSSYKKKLETRKRSAADDARVWNLLYISSDAATDAAAQHLGISKVELLDFDNDEMPVRVSLAETRLIQQTKAWLKDEGINMNAFERKGPVSRNCDLPSTIKRSSDTIIVKHLPFNTSPEDLKELLSRHAGIDRFCVSPSKTVAVVKYSEAQRAAKSFKLLAFKAFMNLPLYLEWAPHDIFSPPPEANPKNVQKESDKNDVVETENGDTQDVDAGNAADDEGVSSDTFSIFVKNLSFATKDAALEDCFSICQGFRCATIRKAKPPKSDDAVTEPRSLGYGHIEFESKEHAIDAMKRMQGIVIDDHSLQLQFSHSKPQLVGKKDRNLVGASRKAKSAIDFGKASNKLIVRNLAFEATKKELKSLFSSCGTVIACRIPKKSDGKSRGYGFVEFISKKEALNALETLQHTHLYGRHLVIEPSVDEVATVANTRKKTLEQIQGREKIGESKKRRLIKDLEDAL